MKEYPSLFFNTWSSLCNSEQLQFPTPPWKNPQQFLSPSPWPHQTSQPTQGPLGYMIGKDILSPQISFQSNNHNCPHSRNSCNSLLIPNSNSIVPLISESASAGQSIGVVMFKDPCLMGIFPLPPLDIPNMALINMIYSSGSYDPTIEPSLVSSSLPVSQDPIPLPSASPSEHLTTSNHKIWWIKRKGGMHKKRKPTKKDPTSRYHVGHHPPSTSDNHARAEVLTSTNHMGERLAQGYHVGTQTIEIIEQSHCFKLVKKWSYRAKSLFQAR